MRNRPMGPHTVRKCQLSKVKNTNVHLSVDPQKYVSQRSKFCFIYIQT